MTTTLIATPEDDLLGWLEDTPVSDPPAVQVIPKSTDPVVVSMAEPVIIIEGLPPAPGVAPNAAVDRSAIPFHCERMVQIGWDAETGTYRLGIV